MLAINWEDKSRDLQIMMPFAVAEDYQINPQL